MEREEILKRILENNKKGEELVKFIENEIPALKKAAAEKHYQKLQSELKEKNLQLKEELEYWRNRIIELEIMNNIKQYPLPSSTNVVNSSSEREEPLEAKDTVDAAPPEKKQKDEVQPASETKAPKKESKKDEKKEKPAKAPKQEKQAAEENKEVNVSRLDLRIGRILSAKKHPDAESLYVEEIDVGEEKHRTVVSGLVKFVPLEEMQNRLVVVLCNLKPAKMRGVTSEAMVMCASTPEKVEILLPPPDSAPGDRVMCDDYPGEPDALLPPKKKIFEQVAPDLKTNGDCVATYKLSALKVANKGVIKSATLTNVQIK